MNEPLQESGMVWCNPSQGLLDSEEPADSEGSSDEVLAVMMPAIEYVHAIEGRLRIKVPEVKRSPSHARRIEERFQAVEGIQEVRANPITGNVLFLHDPGRIAAREILGALIAAGYLGMGIDGGKGRPEGIGELAATVAELLAWVVLRVWKGFNPAQDVIERFVATVAQFLLKLVLGRAVAALA